MSGLGCAFSGHPKDTREAVNAQGLRTWGGGGEVVALELALPVQARPGGPPMAGWPSPAASDGVWW